MFICIQNAVLIFYTTYHVLWLLYNTLFNNNSDIVYECVPTSDQH